jgi:hypothetical protein
LRKRQTQCSLKLRDEILREHSKRQAVRIATWIGNDKRRFAELMEIFLSGEYRLTQRSAWIVSHCADLHPELVNKWLLPMLKRMRDPGIHDAVKRNVLRVMSRIEVPRSLIGKVVSTCYNELSSPASPVAVRVHALSVLVNIAKTMPELTRELQGTIANFIPTAGPGLRARIRIITNQLAKEETL